MRFHIEMEAQRLAAAEMPEDEAYGTARIRFGGEEPRTEQARDAQATRGPIEPATPHRRSVAVWPFRS